MKGFPGNIAIKAALRRREIKRQKCRYFSFGWESGTPHHVGMFATLTEFRDRFFLQNSRPSVVTIRRWCESGALPCRKIGGIWYINVEEFQRDEDQAVIDKVING